MAHKRKEYNGKNIISVYRYMEMCGLFCREKKNIAISHRIVEKKLTLRHHLFPEEISLPIRLPFDTVCKESVLNGSILLVEDDYGEVLPYKKPFEQISERKLTEEEKKSIREKLVQEILEQEKCEEEVLKPGYIKYLMKKSKRQTEEENHILEEMLFESQKEEEEITDKKNRILKKQKRQYY